MVCVFGQHRCWIVQQVDVGDQPEGPVEPQGDRATSPVGLKKPNNNPLTRDGGGDGFDQCIFRICGNKGSGVATGSARCRPQSQRCVQIIAFPFDQPAPVAPVGQKRVGKQMFALICGFVGHGGGFDQGQAQYVIRDVVAVFAVVQQGGAVAVFGQVRPFVAGYLEARGVPACVAMGGPGDAAPLDVVCGLR